MGLKYRDAVSACLRSELDAREFDENVVVGEDVRLEFEARVS